MRISKLFLTDFRCFGSKQTVALKDLTALVGANGSGKSAVLQALVRLFGVSQAERTLIRSDFHLPQETEWDERNEATLRIEAMIEFPELKNKGIDDDPVAACFKHMTLKDQGKPPYCRIRLDGKWNKSNLIEGEVEQKLVWVMCPIDTKPEDEKVAPVQPHDRSRIHVHYVPASRDPAKQIRQVSGSFLHTLLRAVEWSDETKKSMEEASESIRTAFGDEDGVKQVQSAIEQCWNELHGDPNHKQVTIRPVAKRISDLIKQVEATFSPGPADKEDGIDSLSDGQRSLFYLAIVAALFDIQEAVGKGKGKEAISREHLAPPILNLLAVEEPENHVAPHYLGRIMTVLRRVSESLRGQVILSSHSASMLARVQPEEVRQLRTDVTSRVTVVSGITLPKGGSDPNKYIREAVRAYPELYFAKFVVLGEGDSEEIVIPRLAEAKGIHIDASFVSIVPLGGRHVNHFWRLLKDLQIPYVTLLDLDHERKGGGWGRIKYVLEQLLEIGIPECDLLKTTTGTLSRKELSAMHTWDVQDKSTILAWVSRLEAYDVYFSQPLDLDFSMLTAFYEEYKTVAEGSDGPCIPANPKEYKEALASSINAVLKDANSGGSTYNDQELKSFFWYRYLFLGRSKPSTHIFALSKISVDKLAREAPSAILQLIKSIKTSLKDPDAS